MSDQMIKVDRVLKELSELWVSLGKEGENKGGVLRACAMTLVVVADAKEDPMDVGETIANLMRDHPSRAIVVRVTDGDEKALGARVFAQCWMPFGQRQQICCEQIEITADRNSLNEVAPVLDPLTVPDLPVILWCREPALLRNPGFERLNRVAGKLIVNSTTFETEEGPLELVAHLIKSRLVADLAWTRLTRWREMIAQVFENPAYGGCMKEIQTIRIHHAGDVAPTTAYYMSAWLQDGLKSVGADPKIEFQRAKSEAKRGIEGIALDCAEGEGVHLSIRKADSGVEINVNDLINRVMFEPLTDYQLLLEELTIAGRDPVFERTLQSAIRVAQSMKQ